MTDILDRLHERNERLKVGGDWYYRDRGDPVLTDAMEEIKRLRALIEEHGNEWRLAR